MRLWGGRGFMAVRCPQCHRQYDITLFQFGRTVLCECGERLDARKAQEESVKRKPKRRKP